MGAQTFTKDDRYRPFSNGHEHRMWLDINCHRGERGCRRYRPMASSSKDGCPIEVAIAVGSIDDGCIPMRIALRGGFVEPGPDGRLVEVESCCGRGLVGVSVSRVAGVGRVGVGDDPERCDAGPPRRPPGMPAARPHGGERTEAFEGARDALVRASAVRHALATVELREARDADCEPAGTVLGRIWQAG